jgi:RHS repeat-associated protein
LPELDQLTPEKHLENEDYKIDEYGLSLITGDNHAVWFVKDTSQLVSGHTTYTREPGNPYSFATLDKDNVAETYTLTNPDGSKSIFDADGLLLSREDRLGNVLRSYTYDGSIVESITDVSGRATHFANDGDRVTSITDFYGTSGAQTTTLEYDGSGRLLSVTQPDPDGSGPLSAPVMSYAYNASGTAANLLKSVTDPRGLETDVAYDFTRHVSQITERCGGHIQITTIPAQTAVNLASTGFDSEDLATLVDNDVDNSYVISTAEHRVVYGKDEYITRNTNNSITSLTDADGNVTNYTYNYTTAFGHPNAFGLLAEVDQPDPNNTGGTLTTTYTYHNGGTNNYDGDGRISDISYPISSEHWHYDTFGALTLADSYQDLGGFTTSYDIDTHTGSILSTTKWTGTENLTTSYTYTDGLGDTPIKGLIETITDPNLNVTHYTYYSNGLVENIISAEGTPDETTTHYDYDERDRVWKVTDGRNNVTEYDYDNLDQVIQQIDPDPDGSGTGHPLTSPVWNYVYDRNGNQTHIIDPNGNDTQTVYDVRDRQFQVIQPLPSGTPAVTTKEGSDGTFLTSSNTTSTHWSTITQSGADNGDEYATSANGEKAIYTFSGLDATEKYAVEVRWVPSSTSDAYDKNALFEVFGDTGDDPLNKLRVNLNSKPQGLPDDGTGYMWLSLGAFSAYSNTLTVKLRDDDNNGKLVIDQVRLVEAGPVTQTNYDCNGNLVKTIDPLNHVTTYDYDNLNRLVTRTVPDPDGEAGEDYESPVTEYSYNALGWLTGTTDPVGNQTIYQYDDMGRQTAAIKLGDTEGFTAQYFDDSGNALHTRTDATIDFGASTDFAGYDDLPDGFSATWTGTIWFPDFSSDDLTLYLNSTDTCSLYLDGQLVVSHTGSGAMSESSYTIPYVGGLHFLTLTFNDDHHDSGSGVIVSYDSGDGKTSIPTDLGLVHAGQATFTTYDEAGRVTDVTDGLVHGTEYTYDNANRVTRAASVVNTDSGYVETGSATDYTYDVASNLKTLTDSNGNVTTWEYDALNRMKSESIIVDAATLTRLYEYDLNGNLTKTTDRDGRVITYAYDNLNRRTAENWLDGLSTVRTISYGYDAMGNLLSVSDPDASYDYEYDNLNRQTDVTQTISGLTPAVEFGHEFDAAGRMTTASAMIGSYDDYVNNYVYDALGRLITLTQGEQDDTSVAAKHVEFAYNGNNQLTGIQRYADMTTDVLVATSELSYDAFGQVTLIHHLSQFGESTFEEHHEYTYDGVGRVAHYHNSSGGNDDGYSYDDQSQLVSAGDQNYDPHEHYTYDANGNREETVNYNGTQTLSVGDNNRLLSDGLYTYGYDAEGNLTQAFIDTDNDGHWDTNEYGTAYAWDYRNRLTSVTTKNVSNQVSKKVEYKYDAFNQLIYRKLDPDGDLGTGPVDQAFFLYEQGKVVLQFDKSGTGDVADTNLSHRYLWGPAVDQLLADEQVSGLGAGDVYWAMTDRQGSVRNVIDNEGNLRINYQLDSFGNIVAEQHYDSGGSGGWGYGATSNTGYIDEAFIFTGRFYDHETGLQNNLNRWYNPAIGRWMSEDPIGFNGDTSNLYRYVGNAPTNYTDPEGLVIWIVPPKGIWAYFGWGNPVGPVGGEGGVGGYCGTDGAWVGPEYYVYGPPNTNGYGGYGGWGVPGHGESGHGPIGGFGPITTYFDLPHRTLCVGLSIPLPYGFVIGVGGAYEKAPPPKPGVPPVKPPRKPPRLPRWLLLA